MDTLDDVDIDDDVDIELEVDTLKIKKMLSEKNLIPVLNKDVFAKSKKGYQVTRTSPSFRTLQRLTYRLIRNYLR